MLSVLLLVPLACPDTTGSVAEPANLSAWDWDAAQPVGGITDHLSAIHLAEDGTLIGLDDDGFVVRVSSLTEAAPSKGWPRSRLEGGGDLEGLCAARNSDLLVLLEDRCELVRMDSRGTRVGTHTLSAEIPRGDPLALPGRSVQGLEGLARVPAADGTATLWLGHQGTSKVYVVRAPRDRKDSGPLGLLRTLDLGDEARGMVFDPGLNGVLMVVDDAREVWLVNQDGTVRDRRPWPKGTRDVEGITHDPSGALLLALDGGGVWSIPLHQPRALEAWQFTSGITRADLARHTETLASDEFEGRGPASPGEEKTVGYLVDQLKRAGLTPGNGETFEQAVPLISTRPADKPSVEITLDGKEQEIVFGRDLMLVSPRADQDWLRRSVEVEGAELVFCGFGVTAPEYGWNDFDGMDLEGKIVVALVNDPGFATQDPALFRGNAMTYYGRYTYKFEEARRQGAAGCLVVHEEKAAGYPWQVIVRSWGGIQHGLGAADDRPDFEGWITRDAIAKLASAAGHDWEALEESARSSSFRSINLGAKVSVSLVNQSTHSTSRNVVARVIGSEHPDEHILLCAHWDHLGRKEGLGRDEIYNGALDNASGSAGLLELAEAFASLDPPPARSMLFIWVTAEESGLLGSKYYAENPLIPLEETVAGINMDCLNIYGPMQDIEVVGFGSSELEELLAQAAAAQGRELSPESSPEKGYYYRSDHFSLAKKGVPMLYAGGGQVSREHGREWVTARKEEYLRKNYHQPSDEFDSSWDLRGAVEDLRLYYAVARRLANGDEWPTWNKGNEFRSLRAPHKGR